MHDMPPELLILRAWLGQEKASVHGMQEQHFCSWLHYIDV
jgi:hypothetical protein